MPKPHARRCDGNARCVLRLPAWLRAARRTAPRVAASRSALSVRRSGFTTAFCAALPSLPALTGILRLWADSAARRAQGAAPPAAPAGRTGSAATGGSPSPFLLHTVGRCGFSQGGCPIPSPVPGQLTRPSTHYHSLHLPRRLLGPARPVLQLSPRCSVGGGLRVGAAAPGRMLRMPACAGRPRSPLTPGWGGGGVRASPAHSPAVPCNKHQDPTPAPHYQRRSQGVCQVPCTELSLQAEAEQGRECGKPLLMVVPHCASGGSSAQGSAEKGRLWVAPLGS